MVVRMRFSKFVPACLPPRVACFGLGLIVFASTLGTEGCLSYKLTGLYVEPAGACIYPSPSFTAQFHAYGTYTEGGHAMVTKDITNIATWSDDLPGLATMSQTGLATATGSGVGFTNVTAAAQGEFGLVHGSGVLNVKTDCVSATGAVRTLALVPRRQSLVIGDSLQPMAVATSLRTMETSDVTGQVTWESSNPSVATVRGGVISAVGAGDAVITATQTLSDGTAVRTIENIEVTAEASQE
jgi:hypothetical protein